MFFLLHNKPRKIVFPARGKPTDREVGDQMNAIWQRCLIQTQVNFRKI